MRIGNSRAWQDGVDIFDELFYSVASEMCSRARRMAPLSCSGGVATTMIAAIGVANRRPSVVRRKRIVTLMRLADTTRMRGRRHGRHRQRKKIPRERKQ